MSNVFAIADDILITGFGERDKDHVETLEKVLQVCSQVNLKLNKDKCLFSCTSTPFFCEIVSQQFPTDMLPLKKKETAVIPGYTKLPK